MNIRQFCQTTLSLGMLWATTGVVAADPATPAPPTGGASPGISQHANQVRGDEITPQQQHAVELGLAWLAEHQDADGSFKGPGGKNAGVTGLAALSLMEAGNLPGRGKYGENVRRALGFVLSCCQESGLIVGDDSQSPMYGHGFSTLFLGEVYGMTRDETIKEKLQKAVSLIERSQSHQPGNEGGWRYQPVPYDADISVTICQVMALRAARDAGIFVPPGVVDSAIKYVQKCQNGDGGFNYMAQEGGASALPRSAAGVAALYYAGHFQGDDLDKGLHYLQQNIPASDAKSGNDALSNLQGFYFYANYYGAQAMFLAGGDYWSQWFPRIRDQLIGQQTAAGNWSGEVTEDYCTAMALIVLQMPNRYLPVFSGKGPGD